MPLTDADFHSRIHNLILEPPDSQEANEGMYGTATTALVRRAVRNSKGTPADHEMSSRFLKTLYSRLGYTLDSHGMFHWLLNMGVSRQESKALSGDPD